MEKNHLQYHHPYHPQYHHPYRHHRNCADRGFFEHQLASLLEEEQEEETGKVGLGTVNRDLTYLRQQAKDKIRRYIDERLPEEYQKCLVGITTILKEAWSTSYQTQDKREKIQALSLAKECYSMKLELLTNATVVDDAIRFVTQKGTANGEPKSGADPIAMEKEKQEKLLDNNIREKELDNSSTMNQVF